MSDKENWAEAYEEAKWPSRNAARQARDDRSEELKRMGFDVYETFDCSMDGQWEYYLFTASHVQPVTPENQAEIRHKTLYGG